MSSDAAIAHQMALDEEARFSPGDLGRGARRRREHHHPERFNSQTESDLALARALAEADGGYEDEDGDVVVLEDHPKISEKVKTVKLNNGHYILFLAQRLSKLNRFSRMLESGPYYKNWSKSYLRSVKGFRDPSGSRS